MKYIFIVFFVIQQIYAIQNNNIFINKFNTTMNDTKIRLHLLYSLLFD
jgi:hypothetical protein